MSSPFGVPNNTTIFKTWFWKYCWMTTKPAVVAHIWLETEALGEDPNSKEPRYFVDYVIPGDNGDVFVHMERKTLH